MDKQHNEMAFFGTFGGGVFYGANPLKTIFDTKLNQKLIFIVQPHFCEYHCKNNSKKYLDSIVSKKISI